MLDVAILGQVAFGYSPFIDRNRAVSATRLTVFPLKTDSSPDAAQLLHAVGGVWPADEPERSFAQSLRDHGSRQRVVGLGRDVY